MKRSWWSVTLLSVFLLASFGVLACEADNSKSDTVDGDMDLEQDQDESQPLEDGDTEIELESDIEYAFHQVLPIPESGYLADPCVLLVDGVWYLYGTHDAGGFEVWYSEDLTNWTQGPTIWTPTLPWHTENAFCGLWAPHVERAEDAYYLYYTANCRIGVARADSPLGPFEELYDHPLIGNGFGGVGNGVLTGDIKQDWDNLAIDAFLLQAGDGSLILYYTGFTPLSTIYAQTMMDFTTASAEPVQLLEPDVSSWEGLVREGVWVLERGGRFHLMYSGNIFETLDYAIGIATATDPLGPFTRDSRNPILKSHVETGIYGPGHHSVVPGAYGDLLIFYHTKLAPEEGEERLVRYGPLWFDEQGVLQVEQP